ncbi:TetR/AcrR family transcriptional regulator [Streptomyces uncialis]|uniref:TetR family transcriptional regulator n=1 Tax=Streptomyces uncialis TaxID=1048205 RepID=A0A1Q4VB99_9ACTN|nr:TetR/AcrR family transcriptional regulator [Streptomyces uncialis]OKH95142.1 TetR family transcriptional regulator [Streptomyces uncialis]
MHTQDQQWATATATAISSGVATGGGGRGLPDPGRTAPLRVDAQRNLEHVLRAAREVFGELGYGAPMEDVARRARVGVGTVYRRFPSKDVLVRRIAEEETSRLTEQARAALGQEDEPWSALSRFLRTSVASGAGRLLPPHVLRVGVDDAHEETRVPQQRGAVPPAGEGAPAPAMSSLSGAGSPYVAPGGVGESRVVEQRGAGVVVAGAAVGPTIGGAVGTAAGSAASEAAMAADAGADALLEVVGRLVDRARGAGELRADVTVSDVLLVIATAAPSLPDAVQQAAASARLLDILLDGLRSRP